MSFMKRIKMLSLAAVMSLAFLPLVSPGQYQFGERVWSPPGIGATVWSVAPGATNLDRGFPFPFFPFDDLTNIPLYSLGANSYVFEFDWGSYEDLTGREDDGDAGPLDPQWNFGTNLWIEILTVTNKLAYLRLHNTTNIDGGQYYQIWSSLRVDLPLLQWMRGLQVLQDTNSVGHIDFDPVTAVSTAQFFRGVGGNSNLTPFTVVATNVPYPDSIDVHSPSNVLVLSVNTDSANDANLFDSLNSNGVVQPWTGVSTLGRETPIAMVKVTTNGFSRGEMFIGRDTAIIGKVAADAASSNLTWAVLSTDPNSPYYGVVAGLCLDTTGIFGNQLVALTYLGIRDHVASIWLVDSNGEASLLATNRNYNTPEGVIVVPNNPARYGPWAGTIVYGDEMRGTIYTVDTNGTVTPYDTSGWTDQGLSPESFTIVQTNQNLYAANGNSQADGQVLKISSFALWDHVGDIVVPDEQSSPSRLILLHWSAASSAFIPTIIPLPGVIDGISIHSRDIEGVTCWEPDLANLKGP
jgi:hypothetical protein